MSERTLGRFSTALLSVAVPLAVAFNVLFAVPVAFLLPLDTPVPVKAPNVALSFRFVMVLEVSERESSTARGRVGAMAG